MPIQNRDYYGAIQQGIQDRQGRQMNALALQRAQDQANVMGNPNATPEQFARVGRTDIANSLAGLQPDKAAERVALAKEMYQAAQYALASGNAKGFIARNYPQLAARNPTFNTDTEEQVRASLQEALGVFGPTAGIGPAPPPEQMQQTPGPNGSTIISRGGKWEVVQPPKPDKAPERFRTLNPQEIAAAGLPPGTSAQINDATGQINVISKRDITSGLSPKDQSTAKQKLVTIQLAKQQLAAIKQRFQGVKGSFSAGAFGQGHLPTESGKSFDAAVDQMRSTLTALTRTPGVGAMSDYETKLDQSKFPARTNYESVTEQQIQAIEDQLALIENGYKDLLGGGGSPAPAAPTPGQPSLDDIRKKYGR